jgi:hypothetical protein
MERIFYQSHDARRARLTVNILSVGFNRPDTDLQCIGDLAVAIFVEYKTENLPLFFG